MAKITPVILSVTKTMPYVLQEFIRQVCKLTLFTRALTGSKTLAFGSVGSLTTVGTTLTVAGAVVGDAVTITPNSNMEAGISVYGYVGSANTVSILVTNASSGSITMASRTYNVLVLAP